MYTLHTTSYMAYNIKCRLHAKYCKLYTRYYVLCTICIIYGVSYIRYRGGSGCIVIPQSGLLELGKKGGVLLGLRKNPGSPSKSPAISGTKTGEALHQISRAVGYCLSRLESEGSSTPVRPSPLESLTEQGWNH